jgi:hypothetical protein
MELFEALARHALGDRGGIRPRGADGGGQRSDASAREEEDEGDGGDEPWASTASGAHPTVPARTPHAVAPDEPGAGGGKRPVARSGQSDSRPQPLEPRDAPVDDAAAADRMPAAQLSSQGVDSARSAAAGRARSEAQATAWSAAAEPAAAPIAVPQTEAHARAAGEPAAEQPVIEAPAHAADRPRVTMTGAVSPGSDGSAAERRSGAPDATPASSPAEWPIGPALSAPAGVTRTGPAAVSSSGPDQTTEVPQASVRMAAASPVQLQPRATSRAPFSPDPPQGLAGTVENAEPASGGLDRLVSHARRVEGLPDAPSATEGAAAVPGPAPSGAAPGRAASPRIPTAQPEAAAAESQLQAATAKPGERPMSRPPGPPVAPPDTASLTALPPAQPGRPIQPQAGSDAGAGVLQRKALATTSARSPRTSRTRLEAGAGASPVPTAAVGTPVDDDPAAFLIEKDGATAPTAQGHIPPALVPSAEAASAAAPTLGTAAATGAGEATRSSRNPAPGGEGSLRAQAPPASASEALQRRGAAMRLDRRLARVDAAARAAGAGPLQPPAGALAKAPSLAPRSPTPAPESAGESPAAAAETGRVVEVSAATGARPVALGTSGATAGEARTVSTASGKARSRVAGNADADRLALAAPIEGQVASALGAERAIDGAFGLGGQPDRMPEVSRSLAQPAQADGGSAFRAAATVLPSAEGTVQRKALAGATELPAIMSAPAEPAAERVPATGAPAAAAPFAPEAIGATPAAGVVAEGAIDGGFGLEAQANRMLEVPRSLLQPAPADGASGFPAAASGLRCAEGNLQRKAFAGAGSSSVSTSPRSVEAPADLPAITPASAEPAAEPAAATSAASVVAESSIESDFGSRAQLDRMPEVSRFSLAPVTADAASALPLPRPMPRSADGIFQPKAFASSAASSGSRSSQAVDVAADPSAIMSASVEPAADVATAPIPRHEPSQETVATAGWDVSEGAAPAVAAPRVAEASAGEGQAEDSAAAQQLRASSLARAAGESRPHVTSAAAEVSGAPAQRIAAPPGSPAPVARTPLAEAAVAATPDEVQMARTSGTGFTAAAGLPKVAAAEMLRRRRPAVVQLQSEQAVPTPAPVRGERSLPAAEDGPVRVHPNRPGASPSLAEREVRPAMAAEAAAPGHWHPAQALSVRRSGSSVPTAEVDAPGHGVPAATAAALFPSEGADPKREAAVAVRAMDGRTGPSAVPRSTIASEADALERVAPADMPGSPSAPPKALGRRPGSALQLGSGSAAEGDAPAMPPPRGTAERRATATAAAGSEAIVQRLADPPSPLQPSPPQSRAAALQDSQLPATTAGGNEAAFEPRSRRDRGDSTVAPAVHAATAGPRDPATRSGPRRSPVSVVQMRARSPVAPPEPAAGTAISPSPAALPTLRRAPASPEQTPSAAPLPAPPDESSRRSSHRQAAAPAGTSASAAGEARTVGVPRPQQPAAASGRGAVEQPVQRGTSPALAPSRPDAAAGVGADAPRRSRLAPSSPPALATAAAPRSRPSAAAPSGGHSRTAATAIAGSADPAAAMASYLDRNMPAQAPTRSQPAAARTAERAEREASGRGGTPRPATVKVHIGRIRIDAPAPAPPRARFSRPAPSVPLADYLGRRYGR